MLAIESSYNKSTRSTRSMISKDMGPIIGMLKTSEVLDRYDRLRKPEFRDLKFSAVQMMTVLIYIGVKQTPARTSGFMFLFMFCL